MDNLKFEFLKRDHNKLLNIAIFTTNKSFEDIYDIIKSLCNKIFVVVPENRLDSEKIKLVKEVCNKRSIDVLVQPRENRVEDFNDILLQNKVNLGISWSYSQILCLSTLQLFSEGVWNMHGGKIPEYRGANVLQWAIANGETEMGVTWHTMDEKIDGGYIIEDNVIEVKDSENALDIRDKVFDKAVEMFRLIWRKYNSEGIKTKKVDISKGSYYRGRTPLDGLINKTYSKKDIVNLLRAQCHPWPRPIVLLDKLYYVEDICFEDNLGDNILEYICKNGEKVRLKVSEVYDIDLINKVRDNK